ncbi:MAG: glycoside hydrolase family 15 protein [Synechococcales bacterium]|nr:glycoside hydrolase family 15 protein [Synechococcales bacterium]
MTTLRGQRQAFGKFGTPPRWTQGNKDGVGTAYSTASRIWFTLWNGVLTEIYYPTVDRPQTRDLQYLVTIGEDEFQAEKRHLDSHTERMWLHALGYRVTNRDPQGRYTITKEIVTDPLLPCVLQHTRIDSDDAQLLERLRLFALCAPHLEVAGWGNNAHVMQVCDRTLLVAERRGTWLAIAATVPFIRTSVGYVGQSDGWQDLHDNVQMNHEFDQALDGNVALTGELDWRSAPEDGFTLGIAFGDCRHAAITSVLQSLDVPFVDQKERYQGQWKPPCGNETRSALANYSTDGGNLYYSSLSVLMTHEDKTYHGALIASLAIPWGAAKGDEERGGYHLVWVRDMVNSARGLLAAGNTETPLRALIYLATSQQADGGFPQNFWIDGKGHWSGIQLDQVALPITLAHSLRREGALRQFDPYGMMLRAAAYLMRHGPATQQERWEEAGGYSPSTLAISITALICTATLARERGDRDIAQFIEDYADFLESHIETWTVTTEGTLHPEISRHFIRILPAEMDDPTPLEDPNQATLYIINRPADDQAFPARDVVDAGFLELVRYGIRSPHDPLIRDSLAVVDRVLKLETPCGVGWHRYNHDGYGQRADGTPFDEERGGIGRIWPLLSAERGYYELAAGGDVTPLVQAMEGFANETGMLPEQVWDTDDLPEAHLYLGHPTGSAMPLMWAHAEYIKLLRSLADGQVFDYVPEVAERYQGDRTHLPFLEIWKPNRRVSQMKRGYTLRVQIPSNFVLRWTGDRWQHATEQEATMTPLGIAYVDIPAESESLEEVQFAFARTEEASLRGAQFTVGIR